MQDFDNFIKVTQLGTNGLLLIALYKIWAEYLKSQAAYIQLLERCIGVLTNVNTSLAELRNNEKANS